jgi:hypothetical protein
MEEFTSVAFWFAITLLSINVVFTWLTVGGGLMALTVSPDSFMASSTCYTYSDNSTNTISENPPGNSTKTGADFDSAQKCTINSLWTLVGGWQLALGQVFTGGIFGDPTDSSSLGWLYMNFLLPIFVVAQILAMFLVLYRVAIAAKGIIGAAVGI